MNAPIETPEAAKDTRSSETSVERPSLGRLTAYFLKLGTIGFGGPVALVGFMHRDLVERRRWVSEETYRLGLALAQIMPGPLAAQLAIALGYFEAGVLGATLVGLAFVVPSFLMVLALSWAYVAFGGLWWMQAAFYGIGAAVIAIITIAAYKLARNTNKRDPLLWGIFAVLLVATAAFQTELASLFIVAGALVLLLRARPATPRVLASVVAALAAAVALVVGVEALVTARQVSGGGNPLVDILLFFTKAGAFVFGSGLAIVPFLYQGVVQQFHWLSEHQFTDAVAVAMITPGPVVITVAFIGYLVAGVAGSILAAVGIFLPVYVFTVLPAPWFVRHRDNPQLKAFVQGATAAATGAIAGAVIVLGMRSVFDVPTAVIALASLAILWRVKVHEPIVVTVAGVVGLVVWVLTRGTG